MTTVSTPRKIAATATASATLAKGSHTPVNATSGALTMTLPTTAAVGVEISVEKVDTSTNAVTISGTLRGTTGSTITLNAQYDARTFLSEGSGSWRPVSDHRTKTSLDATYSSKGRRVVTTPAPYQGSSQITDPAHPTIVHTLAGIDASVNPPVVYGRDTTNGNFSQSDDGGNTWSLVRGKPANTKAQNGSEKIVVFGNYIWTVKDDATTNLFGVYRSPKGPQATAYAWSGQLFTQRAGMHANVRCMFNAGTQYLYLGDYSDPGVDNPGIYRISLADANGAGTNWETVWGPTATTHHIHAVAEDPYNAGHIYAVLGDNNADACIIRSTNYGAAGTWQTVISNVSGNSWQSVQISFSPKWVWLAGDHFGLTVMVFNRTDLVPIHASRGHHSRIAVPGGTPRRTITDLATTTGQPTATSASAAFTQADRGKVITATTIPNTASTTEGAQVPVYIKTVTNATTITLSANATTTSAGASATIEGDRFYDLGYFGICDPATESFYWAAMDISASGNTQGIFCIESVGDAPTLLDASPFGGVGEFFNAGGFIWTGARKFKAIGSSLQASAGF